MMTESTALATTAPHQADGPAPDALTVDQAAQVLGIGRSSAYELTRQYLTTNGEQGLPAIRLGGLIRVPRCKIEELLGGPITWPTDR